MKGTTKKITSQEGGFLQFSDHIIKKWTISRQ